MMELFSHSENHTSTVGQLPLNHPHMLRLGMTIFYISSIGRQSFVTLIISTKPPRYVS